MFTNITEQGLETLIVKELVERNGYEQGTNDDYSREFAVDTTRLFRFLNATQPKVVERLRLNSDENKKTKFLEWLRNNLTTRGVLDLLRNGIKDGPEKVELFYGTPSEGNPKAQALYAQNIFSVTRQLRYSLDRQALALDLCVFMNGLPIITFELKNRLTKQNVLDAVEQYKTDRSPNELLFKPLRCVVHFAVDDANVRFCTELKGKNSTFLPFDKGYNDGAGNPPNPDGVKTDYLWRDILSKPKLTRILEHYARVVKRQDPETKRTILTQIWPRYHQFDVVEKLVADVRAKGVGGRYLIQHSAGSGKSNSIAWLAHQLSGLQRDNRPVFDSIFVVTDRRILDKQSRDALKRFAFIPSLVVWAERSEDLRNAIRNGKRIIVTTVEKFPFVLENLGNEHRDSRFGIIIDEAHSSQSGQMSASMNLALSGALPDGIPLEMDDDEVLKILSEGRRLLKNASYFAFTATPKNKTLEVFGTPCPEGDEIKHRPFHVYTMKQAIQEGFILDVLQNYTPINSYYRLTSTIEEDPEFDKDKARKKLRAFVENDSYPIAKKASVMVEHFLTCVAKRKIGGKARAMVVTSSISRCIEYFHAITECLEARHSEFKAIIAFSGSKEYHGDPDVTSASLNGFSDSEIPQMFKQDKYRLLVVADMFQTGYDEPLLHTMYVDKPLEDIKAVQTLSRLNRACPQKHDTFVLDFANDVDAIQHAFARYYKATILSKETDPNKLHQLVSDMEGLQVYSKEDVNTLVHKFLNNASREQLDAILDVCVNEYEQLISDDQVRFKGTAKAFRRLYNFLGSVLPYNMPEWEKLDIFLKLLIPKLPSPPEDDLSAGILEAVDLESYRLEKQATRSLLLPDDDTEIDPVPSGSAGLKRPPVLDPLSEIINTFNSLFGNIEWQDEDNVRRQIARIPEMVSKDPAYQNAMRDTDEQNARDTCEEATNEAINNIMIDCTELLNQYLSNQEFQRWLRGWVFDKTYHPGGPDSTT